MRIVIARWKGWDVDPCIQFKLMMELVPPGWGQRYTYVFGVRKKVFDRRIWYMDWIDGSINEYERTLADQLLDEVQREPAPADWKDLPIIVIRPDRDGTIGNQTWPEKFVIRHSMVRVPTNGPSDFAYFKPR